MPVTGSDRCRVADVGHGDRIGSRRSGRRNAELSGVVATPALHRPVAGDGATVTRPEHVARRLAAINEARSLCAHFGARGWAATAATGPRHRDVHHRMLDEAGAARSGNDEQGRELPHWPTPNRNTRPALKAGFTTIA